VSQNYGLKTMKNRFAEKFSLIGKTAVITGASGMLGQKHTLALLELGATVVMTDIDIKSLEQAKAELKNSFPNGEIETLVMNVVSEDSVFDANIFVSKNIGRVDILINNAAINPTTDSLIGNTRTTRLENFSLDRWSNELAVGLTGSYLCSKIFGSAMASDGQGGVILNIASDLSVIAPDQKLYRQEHLPDELQAVKPVTYSVVKAGVVGLTRYLSSYWAHKGVRANALSPGGVYVDQDAEFVTRLEQLIPMGRMAQPDEYIGAIQFLCSDASAYMNGQNIVMDGGRSVI
jgi:NAD(P)-dependent dehydrogenase (short-subunit alcohol dehydrogenase family)